MATVTHKTTGDVGNSSGNIVARSANNAIAADVISEVTSAAGVTIDGVLCKDGGVTLVVAGAASATSLTPGASGGITYKTDSGLTGDVAAHIFQTYHLGSYGDRFVVKANGNVVVGTDPGGSELVRVSGSIACPNSGAGIKLPTAPGNSDVNTLDCYKEGTWTPVLSSSGTSMVRTYSIQEGAYVLIGRMCHFHIKLIINGNTTTGTGYVMINLPFAASYHQVVNFAHDTCVNWGTVPITEFGVVGSFVYLLGTVNGAAGAINLQATEVSTTAGHIRVDGCYMIAGS